MTKIKDLKFDEHNFNLHTEEGMQLLQKSVERNGFGRSALIDKDNNIIAGNGIVEAAIKAGKTKLKIVETNGEELVVVKRTDLDINTEEGREMAYADNAVAYKNLSWNEDELRSAKEAWNLDVSQYGMELTDEIDVEAFLSQQSEEVNFSTKSKIVVILPNEDNLQEVRDKIMEAVKGIKGAKIK